MSLGWSDPRVESDPRRQAGSEPNAVQLLLRAGLGSVGGIARQLKNSIPDLPRNGLRPFQHGLANRQDITVLRFIPNTLKMVDVYGLHVRAPESDGQEEVKQCLCQDSKQEADRTWLLFQAYRFSW